MELRGSIIKLVVVGIIINLRMVARRERVRLRVGIIQRSG